MIQEKRKRTTGELQRNFKHWGSREKTPREAFTPGEVLEQIKNEPRGKHENFT